MAALTENSRRFPFPVPRIGGAGKTGKWDAPKFPPPGKTGKTGNDDIRIVWTRCMVLWDNFGDGVRNVEVVRHPATVDYRQTYSDGACWIDWATGKRRPADLFGALLVQGFADGAELRRALAEFSRVAGCGWASRMLAGMREWEGES